MPRKRVEARGLNLSAAESLQGNPGQHPGAIWANVRMVRLNQPLERAAGRELVQIDVTGSVAVREAPHVQELALACSPEAVTTAHGLRRGKPRRPLRLRQLLSGRNHKLRQQEQ